MPAFFPLDIPHVEAALRDAYSHNSRARSDAALGLGAATGEDRAPAIRELVRLLEDPFLYVRYNAALSLGELLAGHESPAEAESLFLLLEDPAPLVRQAAVVAIGALGRAGGPRAFEPLLKALRSANADVRFQAALSLAEAAPEVAVDPLIEALLDSDAGVRGNAAAALGQIGDPRAGDALARRLGDPSADARFEAAFALAALGDARGSDVLLAALDDRDRAHDAARALGRVGDARARAALSALWPRILKPVHLRLGAAAAAHRLGDGKAGDFIARMCESRRRAGQELAIHLAGELRLDAARGALERLQARPGAADPQAIAESLAALGPARAAGPVGDSAWAHASTRSEPAEQRPSS